MMLGNTLLGFGVASALVMVVASVLIMIELDRRNIKTSIILSRLYIIKYVNQYKTITVEETGKPGPLWHVWIISINFALVFVIAGIVAM